jgi:hypothetical protein
MSSSNQLQSIQILNMVHFTEVIVPKSCFGYFIVEFFV